MFLLCIIELTPRADSLIPLVVNRYLVFYHQHPVQPSCDVETGNPTFCIKGSGMQKKMYKYR